MTGGSLDIAFHYPPELFNLLVDVVPLLNRSKRDVLTFFRGAGVADALTADLSARPQASPDQVNKYEMVRTVLERLNEKGEPTLRERREVLRRVVDFSNFDTCWPDDQLKAKGLVASIREVVNQKDAFTRMDRAREEERQARLAEAQRTAQERRVRVAKVDAGALRALRGIYVRARAWQEAGDSPHQSFSGFRCSCPQGLSFGR
jgi:restriction system protein